MGKFDEVVRITGSNFDDVEDLLGKVVVLVASLSKDQVVSGYAVLKKFKQSVGHNVLVTYISPNQSGIHEIWKKDAGVEVSGVFFYRHRYLYSYYPVPMEGGITYESLMTAYHMYRNNTLPPIMRSKPIP